MSFGFLLTASQCPPRSTSRLARLRWTRWWLTSVFGMVLCPAIVSVGQPSVDYLRDIKPLLRERCYACHGALKQKARLRLDTVPAMLQGGKSGPAFTPRESARSLLLERVSTTRLDERMPPEHEGEPLSAAQVTLLRSWIQQGASFPPDDAGEADPQNHWAFRPRHRPPVPVVANAAWVRNPIDAFLAREHERQGLQPAPEASREVLVRRLYQDLIGLPPSADELLAARLNAAPDWYEQLVEHLLADPRHGERWARHWMDIWRYSDWWGLGDQLRNSQKHIWHWRDWIIESLNNDTPYDEMIRLMLAADESHPNDLARLRATGYLGRNYFLFNRNQWLEETVEHVGKAFLGLTLNCAKCHDHKYDPISQVDFYRMRAFFEPYQVRVDVLPGESDLNRDGVPRVYDSFPAPVTYRFIRGQEKDPDKSVAITPGVPELLAFRELAIQPKALPVEAWQPDRRSWVAPAYLKAARAKVDQADRAVTSARNQKLSASPTPDDLKIQESAVAVAELFAQLARSDLNSLETRLAALQCEWSGAGSNRLEEARVAAVRAERTVAVARSQHQVADLELRKLRASADQKAALDKELQTAGEALEKSRKQLEQPIGRDETYARLSGASWTPTRFLDSTKDDPKVEFASQTTGRRTALAAWITDPRHPLTARVAVNHLWMRHLGVPLVTTVFDFGRKGGSPVFPELVDWLASELVDSGWSMKHLHRLIVTSSAYRMSSSVAGRESNLTKDPDNLRWWRRVPIRIEAQVIRDSILAQAGQLDLTRGGPPVAAADQENSRRRSLYFFHSNNDRNLFLTTFDDAAVKECYRRDQSVVPQQALALSNSRLVQESAPLIATRLMRSVGMPSEGPPRTDAAFIRLAFLTLLGFEPSEAESSAASGALEQWRTLPRGETTAPAAREDSARAHLVWALLNHNDYVTLR